MKKVITLACAALLSLGMMQANVLLNEHFDRTLGTLSASTWSGGSIPNDSNWHTYSPGTVQYQVVAKQLQMADYCTATTGKAVEYSANHSRDYILFKNAFAGAAGNKVLMAFLLKVDELQTTSSAQSASNANNSILSFAISESNNALGSLNGRVLIKTVDANTYNLGVTRRGETPQFAQAELKTGKTYLVVAEYAFVDGEKNDIVSLYINPTKVEQTVAVSSVNTSSASADAEQLVGVALCSNGNTPTGMLIDEIRVATDWQELWEDSSVPTPQITVAGSLSFDKVTIGEAAQKELTVKGANLQGAIAVSSDKTELVPAVSAIAQADAEKDGGYALTLTLTASKEGAGSANLTLSTAGASDQIVAISWTAAKPVPPAGTELLGNGSFEQYSCNAMFGCSFDDWNLPLGSATAEENDKLNDDISMSVKPTSNAALDQGVTLNDADYAAGTLFELTIHYKVLSLPSGSVDLDCYWEPAGSGDAEAMKQHDADVLQRAIATAVSSEWEELTVTTSKPANSTYFRVRLKIPKNAQVLLDAFSLVQKESTEPYINVVPGKLNPVETTVGKTVTFQTLHIKQGNLSGTTVFELSYTNADQFTLSRSSLAADQSECDLVITYAPTAAGAHIAYLNIDNGAHPVLHQSIKLQGTCTDPSQVPTISATPSELAFEAVAGQEATKTVSVTSVNCLNYVYLRVEHISPAEHGAFTIDDSMLPKNGTREVTVRFKPLGEGEYNSTLTIYSEGAESVVVTLNGTATKASEETIDWQTQFAWGGGEPLTRLDEHFDQVEHNKTLALEGWQNVAAVDQRPWWGFDESKTSPVRGEGKYAKATAYQYAKETTGVWEMWLVTPALDYKNAANKIFAFSVMGENLPEEDAEMPTKFEVYYIDPDVDGKPYFQNLTESFAIPKVSDDNLTWFPFYMDLAPHAGTMADVFYMAFHYASPNGGDGAVTYYVDDVSWGVYEPSGTEQVSAVGKSKKILRDGKLIILHNGKEYSPMGQEIR